MATFLPACSWFSHRRTFLLFRLSAFAYFFSPLLENLIRGSPTLRSFHIFFAFMPFGFFAFFSLSPLFPRSENQTETLKFASGTGIEGVALLKKGPGRDRTTSASPRWTSLMSALRRRVSTKHWKYGLGIGTGNIRQTAPEKKLFIFKNTDTVSNIFFGVLLFNHHHPLTLTLPLTQRKTNQLYEMHLHRHQSEKKMIEELRP